MLGHERSMIQWPGFRYISMQNHNLAVAGDHKALLWKGTNA